MNDVVQNWNLHGHADPDDAHPHVASPPDTDLAEALLRGDISQRILAAEVLKQKTAVAPFLMATLLNVLTNDSSVGVRWRVAEAVRVIGPRQEATSVLISSMRNDPSRSVRWRVAEAIGEAGSISPDAIRALINAVGDEDEWVRWHAKRVLGELVPQRDLIEAAVSTLMSEAAVALKLYAAEVLEEHRCGLPLSVDPLLAAANDANPQVRARAVLALGCVDMRSSSIADALSAALADSHPEVRSAGVLALGSHYASATWEGTEALLAALCDLSPDVRVCAAVGLRQSKSQAPAVERALRTRLQDPALKVRTAAALALIELGRADVDVLLAVKEAGEDLTLEAWQILVRHLEREPYHSERVLEHVSPRAVSKILSEDVSKGILPTIGLRIWAPGAEIRFPAKEGGDDPEQLVHPWTRADVFHSWRLHQHLAARSDIGTVQACFHARWFPDIHLIAIADLILYPPPNWTTGRPPARIEGRGAAFIVEGGGRLTAIEGMRLFSSAANPNRIDFLFAHDLRMLQYLLYAGLVTHLGPSAKVPQDQYAQIEWRAFHRAMLTTLTDHGLHFLATEQWFLPDGWRSSRYGYRHERRYSEIRPGIAGLLNLISSSAGDSLRHSVLSFVQPILDRLDAVIWAEGLAHYPRHLLRALSRSRLGPYAEQRIESAFTTASRTQ